MLHEGESATNVSEMRPYGARSEKRLLEKSAPLDVAASWTRLLSRSRARPEIGNIANLIAQVCWRDGRGLKKLISRSHGDTEKSI
jgi:hypothetical protein